jgi:hypothetical protein
MSQFTKIRVDITKKENPLQVSKLTELISNTLFEKEIRENLEIDKQEKDYVDINGAREILNRISATKDKYVKLDVLAPFRNVTLTAFVNQSIANNNLFHLSFDNDKLAIISYPNQSDTTEEEKANISTEVSDKAFAAQPIYDAQTQLFQILFELDKHANDLIEKNKQPDNLLINILSANIERIKEYYSRPSPAPQLERRYRLLRQKSDGKYFFRASVSRAVYKDYDLGVSVFIALMSMHQVMKSREGNYTIKYFSYNESEIDVFFEDANGKKIPGVGEARFQVHLTNSELGNGAVKMMGLFSIIVDIDGKKVPVQMRRPDSPEAYSDTIISIRHGSGPEKAIKEMAADKTITAIKKLIFDDLERINSARDAESLRKTFVSRLDNSRTIMPSDATQAELKKVYNEHAKNFEDLLKIMGKAQLLIEEEGIEVKDSLRNMVYSIIMGPSGNNNQSNGQSK